MKTALLTAVLAMAAINISYAENKKGQTNIDPFKGEGTVNTSKDGTWQAGASKPPTKPEASQTEADRRREQQNSGGQAFIRKTFP